MARDAKKDNSTFREKKALRKRALQDLAAFGIDAPVVMETNGGFGKLFDACYAHLRQGVVLEKDARRTATLAKQRPTWAVYECDCVPALAGGVGAHLPIELLDVDPYGSSLEIVQAFFTSARPFAPLMALVVNDGLRQALSMGAAWSVKILQPYVEKYGNDLYPVYGELCEEFVREKAAAAGYTVSRYAYYYTGNKTFETHYYALLTR